MHAKEAYVMATKVATQEAHRETKDVLDEIRDHAANGEFYAIFYRKDLSESGWRYLTSLGYSVLHNGNLENDIVKVSWKQAHGMPVINFNDIRPSHTLIGGGESSDPRDYMKMFEGFHKPLQDKLYPNSGTITGRITSDTPPWEDFIGEEDYNPKVDEDFPC